MELRRFRPVYKGFIAKNKKRKKNAFGISIVVVRATVKYRAIFRIYEQD